MSGAWRRLLIAAAAIAALWLLWGWWRSPQRQVYRRLDGFAQALGKHGGENALGAAMAARAVGEFFAPGFIIRAHPYADELRDPQQLMGAVVQLHTGARTVDVDVSDRAFTAGPGGTSAVVTFVGTATVDRGGGPGRERWRVRSLWVLDAGEWKMSELELVERLEGGNVFGM